MEIMGKGKGAWPPRLILLSLQAPRWEGNLGKSVPTSTPTHLLSWYPHCQ